MITKARNVASGHVIDIIDTKNSSTSVCWTSVLCLIFRQIDVNVFYLFVEDGGWREINIVWSDRERLPQCTRFVYVVFF